MFPVVELWSDGVWWEWWRNKQEHTKIFRVDAGGFGIVITAHGHLNSILSC
jgi:hypothetical protein